MSSVCVCVCFSILQGITVSKNTPSIHAAVRTERLCNHKVHYSTQPQGGSSLLVMGNPGRSDGSTRTPDHNPIRLRIVRISSNYNRIRLLIGPDHSGSVRINLDQSGSVRMSPNEPRRVQ